MPESNFKHYYAQLNGECAEISAERHAEEVVKGTLCIAIARYGWSPSSVSNARNFKFFERGGSKLFSRDGEKFAEDRKGVIRRFGWYSNSVLELDQFEDWSAYDLHKLQEELGRLKKECDALREENYQLKQHLEQFSEEEDE
ncbi:MAG: hypothetical protein HGA33_00530 [Candidatus Moranbacteria bacterium]|nr:hypothetical protein [Candidatus Moranbacteria bacterium]